MQRRERGASQGWGIIIDEVHVGTSVHHVLFKKLRSFHPESSIRTISQTELFTFLYNNGVKFLFVSATPDAIKETLEHHWMKDKFNIVVARPESVPSYVWHKDFLQHGRIQQALAMTHNTQGNTELFHFAVAKQIKQYDRPLYHMIRFSYEEKKKEVTSSLNLLQETIKKLGVDVDFVLWDSKNGIKEHFKKVKYAFFQNERMTPSKMMAMSNEDILREKPIRHTIFVLKEFFRVSQTMPIDNVGILLDRDTRSPCDSTFSQSLVGRACGHNKHKYLNQIMIYTHVPSVINYIKLWENDFDYAKVPNYVGNGLRISKAAETIQAHATMLGKNVKRCTKAVYRLGPQDDTPERLEKVLCAYRKRHTIVNKLLLMYKENKFNALPYSILQTASKSSKFNIHNYAYWEDKHNRYKILEKSNGDYWSLRPIIINHLGL